MDGANHNPTTPQAGGAADQPAAQTSTVQNIMAGMLGETPSTEPGDGKAGDNGQGDQKGIGDTGLPAWASQLPEELRTNEDAMKRLGKFPKIGDLAKSYTELESKLGNHVQLPGDTSTPEEVDAFFRKLGKPENVDGYEIPEEDRMEFRKIAYDNNLTAKQAKAVYEAIAKFGRNAIEANAKAMEAEALKTQQALEKTYGSKLQETLEIAKKGIKDFGGPELGNLLSSAGLLNSLPVVELFIKLGKLSEESPALSKGAGGGKDTYRSLAEGGHLSFGNDFK